MTDTQLSDEELALLFQEGDLKAFEELTGRYKKQVFRIVRNRIGKIGSDEDAQELIWDVFLKVYSKIDQFKSGDFSSWISTIARNAAIDFTRKNRELHFVNEEEVGIVDLPSLGLLPEEEVSQQKMRWTEAELLTFSLVKLEKILVVNSNKEDKKRGKDQLEVFRLYYIDGKTQPDIMERTEISESNWIDWIGHNRILKRLANHLLDQCREEFGEQFLSQIIDESLLSNIKAELLHKYWVQKKSLEVIESEIGMPIKEVRRILREVAREAKQLFSSTLIEFFKQQRQEAN